MKRKDTSGERESLLSGDARGSFEDEDLEGEKLANISGGSLQYPSSLDIPELPQTPSFSSLGDYHDCNGRSLHLPTDLSTNLSKKDSIAEEDMDDVSDGLMLCCLLQSGSAYDLLFEDDSPGVCLMRRLIVML